MTLERRIGLSQREVRAGYARHTGPVATCDMCGKTRGVRKVEHFEGSIWLCHACNDQINHLSRKLDEITELFIIGNAL